MPQLNHVPPFLALPDELMLHIIQHLDLERILILRQTCRLLASLTHDRHTWIQLLRRQRERSLPLPPHLKYSSSWEDVDSGQIEAAVRLVHLIDRFWLLPRSQYIIPGHRPTCQTDDGDDGGRTVYSIDVLLDRWLLCIYQEKTVELWDLDLITRESHQPLLCTSQRVTAPGSFSSAITHLDAENNVLTVAVSCHESCHIMQVRLPTSWFLCPLQASSSDVSFSTIAVISFSSPIFSLRAIDPSQSLLLLGLHTSFQLINWKTRQRTNVQMVSDEEEELWNGVVGVVFLTQRHFLVLKTHSLEVCTLFDDSQKVATTILSGTSSPLNTPTKKKKKNNNNNNNNTAAQSSFFTSKLPPSPEEEVSSESASDSEQIETKLPVQMSAVVHTHFFPNTTFGGVSFSRPIIQPPSPADTGGDEITQASLSFLAYDVLRGLFHCHVDITIPTPSGTHKASPPLEVQVHLLAAHNMATPVTPGTEGTKFPRSGFSRGARGFVLSCALGPTGQRGVWIERRRGEVRRVVYGFAAPAVPEGDEEVVGVALADGPNPEGIQPGTAISVINSELGPDDTHSSWISPPPRAIEGKEMYEVNSYDLRDDITHIALSETTGIIALGTRKGDIRVLGPVGILGVRRNGV